MIDKRQDPNLNHEQRRNLAHIAKILQYSASKLGRLSLLLCLTSAFYL